MISSASFEVELGFTLWRGIRGLHHGSKLCECRVPVREHHGFCDIITVFVLFQKLKKSFDFWAPYSAYVDGAATANVQRSQRYLLVISRLRWLLQGRTQIAEHEQTSGVL